MFEPPHPVASAALRRPTSPQRGEVPVWQGRATSPPLPVGERSRAKRAGEGVSDMNDLDRPDDPWTSLRALTAARIGLARSGASLATRPLLEFRLAHARARDAVHEPLDEPKLRADLEALGLPVLTVASAAKDRTQYLMRPDLGRMLADGGATMLGSYAGDAEVAFVVTDGLSARAVQAHATPLLAAALPALMKEHF